jgi:putative phage-type endonuclease
MNEDLIKFVYDTYYSHVSEAGLNDTIKLLKIIFKNVPEETIRSAISLNSETGAADEVKVNVNVNVNVNVKVNIADGDCEPPKRVQETQSAPAPDNLIESLRARQLTGDQRSQEWLLQRVNYITASVSAACAGIMGASAREAQLLEKASCGRYRSFMGGYHTDMGNIFEDITAKHYSRLNNTVVHDFRLIPHDDPEYSFLGASTDGVSEELNNIEIKTLAGRPLDHKIKKEYYHQMQHQMACLGLHQTHFLEAKYETFNSVNEAASVGGDKPYGIALEFYSSETGFTYLYSDIAVVNIDALKNWEIVHVYDTEPGCYIRSIYWRMSGYQMKIVKREPQWIIDMGPALKQFWTELSVLKTDPGLVDQLIIAKENKKRAAKGRPPIDCLLK